MNNREHRRYKIFGLIVLLFIIYFCLFTKDHDLDQLDNDDLKLFNVDQEDFTNSALPTENTLKYNKLHFFVIYDLINFFIDLS